jgi:hypothetical protein
MVAPTWLAATLREIERGAEAVGGRILVDPRERRAMDGHVRRRFLRNVGYYALVNEVEARLDPRPADPWPRHDQFFGASLAVTAGTYWRVGGLPLQPSGEDVALGCALRRVDIDVRHSPEVRVFTSARLRGRARDGLADQLAAWSTLGDEDPPHYVPSAADVVARATCRRALRVQWQQAWSGDPPGASSDVARLAEVVGVPDQWLNEVILRPTPFGALLEDVEAMASWPMQDERVDIRAAIADLRIWLGAYRRREAPPAFVQHRNGLTIADPSQTVATSRAHTIPSPPLATLEGVQAIRQLAPSPQVA